MLVDGDRMPGASFFPDARLNFAENLLRRYDDADALVLWTERGRGRTLSYAQLGDAVDARAVPGVENRPPAALAVVPGMRAAELARELHVRHHPVMEQQQAGRDLAPLAAMDEADRFEAVRADRGERAYARMDRDARAAQPPPHRHSLPEVAVRAKRTGQLRDGRNVIGGAGRLEQRRDLRARIDELACGEQQQRAPARQHDRAVWRRLRRLEHDLRGPGAHDAGKRPAGNRHRALHRAGRHDQPFRTQRARPAALRNMQGTIRVHLPDRRLASVVDPAVFAGHAEAAGKRRALAVIGPENVVDPRRAPRVRRDVAVNLPAGLRLLVQHGDAKAVQRRLLRRRHAGGSGADHRDVAGAAHPATSRAPSWRRSFMPSRTRTMQACRFGTPSISIRQSKQTPIMQ